MGHVDALDVGGAGASGASGGSGRGGDGGAFSGGEGASGGVGVGGLSGASGGGMPGVNVGGGGGGGGIMGLSGRGGTIGGGTVTLGAGGSRLPPPSRIPNTSAGKLSLSPSVGPISTAVSAPTPAAAIATSARASTPHPRLALAHMAPRPVSRRRTGRPRSCCHPANFIVSSQIQLFYRRTLASPRPLGARTVGGSCPRSSPSSTRPRPPRAPRTAPPACRTSSSA